MMQIIKAVIIAVAVPAVAAVKPADANAAKSTRRGKLPKLGGGIGRTKTEKTGALAKLRKTAQTPWWNPSNVDNVHQVVQRSGMKSGYDEIGPSHPGLTRRYLPNPTGALAKLRKTAQTPWWNPSNVDNVHQVVQRSGMTSGFDEIGPSHPGLTRRYLPTMTKPQADDASAANGPPGDSGNGSA